MVDIRDVAREAGVSISTVSYALSGKRSIAADTRARIDRVVSELGYRPNAGARMLAGTRTNILALTAPLHGDTYLPSHMKFVTAVATAARGFDYDVLLLTHEEATAGLERVAASALVDGIILMDVDTEDSRVDVIRRLGVPATFIGIPGDCEGLVCVDLDFERAAEMAVERLHALGHGSIGLVGHPSAIYERGSNFAPRFRDSFRATCERLGIDAFVVTPEQAAHGVRGALDELTAALPGHTAIVLNCNEPVSVMVLEALRERAIRVPADLSVVSACSSFSTDHFSPPLDVIPLPAESSGRRAVELTMAQLAGPVGPVVELIEPTYEARGSTARR